MENKQVLIDSLPEGKLKESDYKVVKSELQSPNKVRYWSKLFHSL